MAEHGKPGQGIGARVLRKEDSRHLHGRGQFVSDMILPGQREVAFLRSPIAHARIAAASASRPAARRRVFVREDMAGGAADRRALDAADLQDVRAAAAGARQGALRRRAGRDVRRADARGGRGPRRAGRGRFRGAAGARRCRDSARESTSRARARGVGRQPVPDAAARQRLRRSVEARRVVVKREIELSRQAWCRWRARACSRTGTTAPTSWWSTARRRCRT